MEIDFFEIIKKVITVMAPMVIMFVSMILTIWVYGYNQTKRFPIFAVVSMLLNYVTFIFLKDILGVKSAIVVWQSLNCIPIIVLLFSIFKKRNGNVIVDLLSLILSIGLFMLPFLSNWNKEIDYSLKVDKIPLSDTWLLSISSYVFAIVSLFAYYMLGKMMKDKTEDNKRYASLKEEIRKIQDKQTFKDAFSQASEYDMERLVDMMTSEIVSKIKHSHTFEIHGDANIVTGTSRIESREILSDIKHSMTTPLSQILTNCELIKTDASNVIGEYVTRIEEITKLCLVIVNSYVEQAKLSKGFAAMNIHEGLAAMNLYKEEYHKHQITLDYKSVPQTINGYTDNQILTLLQPLVQNAIYASPDNSEVKIVFVAEAKRYFFRITNKVETMMPTMDELNTIGYSSKEGHEGLGIQTVRNQLRMMDAVDLSYQLGKDTVTAIIELRRNKNG